MTVIALRRTQSKVVAGPTVEGWEQGEVDRGWPPVIGLGWGLGLALW